MGQYQILYLRVSRGPANIGFSSPRWDKMKHLDTGIADQWIMPAGRKSASSPMSLYLRSASVKKIR